MNLPHHTAASGVRTGRGRGRSFGRQRGERRIWTHGPVEEFRDIPTRYDAETLLRRNFTHLVVAFDPCGRRFFYRDLAAMRDFGDERGFTPFYAVAGDHSSRQTDRTYDFVISPSSCRLYLNGRFRHATPRRLPPAILPVITPT